MSLLTPHGFAVEVSRHQLAWTAPSAREFLAQETSNHPLAVASLNVLEQLGQAEELRARLLAILEDGNEDPGRFLITSPYVIATAIRDPEKRHR